MSNEIKKIAPQILRAIKNAKKILLHCHPSPDPDSMGSALSTALVLKQLGKKFTLIAGDSQLPVSLASLPGYEQIVRKNFTQINPADYDLFIILDSSTPNQISKLMEINFPKQMTTVVIDHHLTNLRFGNINLVDPTNAATCQLLYGLFTAWKIKIDTNIAVCLYLGIYSDTGGFKYNNTTADTLAIASDLAKINPNFSKYIFAMENNREPKQIEYLGLALSSLEKYFDGQVVMAAIPYPEFKKHNILNRHTDNMEISNTIKSVIGWEIGICFEETEPNKVSVSLRTRDTEKYDVSKIARAVGAGGGHKAAAGTTISEPYAKAKTMLLETIGKVYPELK